MALKSPYGFGRNLRELRIGFYFANRVGLGFPIAALMWVQDKTGILHCNGLKACFLFSSFLLFPGIYGFGGWIFILFFLVFIYEFWKFGASLM